jgi:tetratricopeptide (TPR) repeat protein
MDEKVLEAALAANRNDATAHALLGALLFSKGLYDPGLEHWAETKRLTPRLPVLDAEMGKAWLHIKDDPGRALISFEEGMENDPTNADIYVGLDEAMSLTGVSAKERVAALGRFPATVGAVPVMMPANLVYQVALTRAEAGQYDGALALFKDRFLPSAEGGVNVEQVQFEIELMQAESEAASGRCNEAEKFLGAGHPGLVVNGAASRAYVRMAAIAKSCLHLEQFSQLLEKAAVSESAADSAWSDRARKLLGSYDAAKQQGKLEGALAGCERSTRTSAYTGWWWYNIGTIQMALSHTAQARDAFNRALLLPDSLMSHHLSRAAIVDLASVDRVQ